MALEGLVRHDGRRRRVVSMVLHEADHSQTELALVVYLLIITISFKPRKVPSHYALDHPLILLLGVLG